MAGEVQGYDSTFFTSISTELGVGTVVRGTATTAMGCKSRVSVEMFEGQVTGFGISPTCPRADVGV